VERLQKDTGHKGYMKRFSIIAGLMLLIGGYIGIVHKQNRSEAKTKSEELARDNAIKQSELYLASKYNAVVDWEKGLNSQEAELVDLTDYYSLQVENALIKHNSRPVLINGILIDILKRNDKYYMVFSMDEGARLELESNQKQIEGILNKQHYLRHAIIGTIFSARRTTGADTESDSFIIQGKLIDLLCLEDYSEKQ
jgi:hypothetical protein